jgi:hypothetical protein
MDERNKPNVDRCPQSLNSSTELEFRLGSLQSLVCELLCANQELREALRKAQPDPHVSQGPRNPSQTMETA